MNSKNITLGAYYRHVNNPHQYWAKAIRLWKPGEGVNSTPYILVECEWSEYQSSDEKIVFGLIKYFRPAHLRKPKATERNAGIRKLLAELAGGV